MLSLTNSSTVVYSPTGRFAVCEGTNEQSEYEGHWCKFILVDLKSGQKLHIKLTNDFEWISYPWDINLGYFSYRVHNFYWVNADYLVVCFVNRIYIEFEEHILYRIDVSKRNKEFEPITIKSIYRNPSKIDLQHLTTSPSYITTDEIEPPTFMVPGSKSNVLKRIWQFVKRILKLLKRQSY